MVILEYQCVKYPGRCCQSTILCCVMCLTQCHVVVRSYRECDRKKVLWYKHVSDSIKNNDNGCDFDNDSDDSWFTNDLVVAL